jgi:flavin reductase (DIM6/NTAB) family NADH-FMN oxidoreductase RutF
MIKNFKKFSPADLKLNPFTLIGDEWMLITAGKNDSFNTMTASWGAVGHLWNMNIAVCFIRPTRHTFTFTEKNEFFTLSFFDEEHRKKLDICGSKSGRNFDKIKATGLKPLATDAGNVYFEQARMVFECRKLYFNDINPKNFADKKLVKLYPLKDYHRMYVGEIVNVLMKGKRAKIRRKKN